MKKYTLTLDVKDDPSLIQAYKEHHQAVWPEVQKSIIDSGIERMEIYHVGDRLVMTVEARDDFSFEKKNALDQNNPKVQEWEELMDQYQKRLPFAAKGEKWVVMNKIFEL
ncbi:MULTISPECIES: L-rhamnose mutarotase [Reichenbachiella]|uniref:L-rhamnose mutarotase n=1 Tax=Reichenbachiella TaxID=156993 RepID=UPI000C14CDD1|nr:MULTISPECIES: L-rhamnose mutarotase [Reichenbachiella]MBU2914134.1 L-rhamnose mutarotase [Reichenbachiella agariperforans]PIB34880.1 L-fucose mutarotase [Reichenbachiella sp. 5M10]RJE73971.1 L-fucose mutarotase [Reichenbachiella sp. MSK19-1]